MWTMHVFCSVALLLAIAAVYALLARHWDPRTRLGRLILGGAFGLAAVVCVLGATGASPALTAWGVVWQLALPVAVVFPLALLALGMLPGARETNPDADAALREANARLALALRSSDIGFYDWDLRTGTLYFSPEWKAQLGYADHEIPNRYEEWESRLHPDDRDRAIAAGVEYRAGRAPEYELEVRLRHKDGSYRWIYTRGEVLRDADGTPYRMAGCHVDVTPRRQAEEALRRETERARMYFQHAGCMFVVLDTEGRVTQLNDQACKVLACEESDAVGKDWFDTFLPAANREGTRRVFRQLMAGQVAYVEHYDNAVLTRNGDERLVAWYNAILRGDDGTIIGTLSSGEDVTDRRRVEMERDRFFDLSTDMLAIAGFDGYCKQINAAWERTLGWTREEMMARPWRDFVYPEDGELTIEAHRKLLAGESLSDFQSRWLCKDGGHRWLSLSANTHVDEGLIFAVARDITERKELDERVEQIARFPRENPSPVVRISGEGDVLYLNPAGGRLLALALMEGQGRVRPEFLAQIRDAARGGGRREISLKAEGRAYAVVCAEVPEGGYFNLYAHDVTEQLITEERLRQSQKMEAVGRLAGGIAHDFNNIITGIRGYVDFALEALNEESQEHRDLKDVMGLADRAAALTKQLLAFSRRQTLDPVVLNLNTTIRNLTKLLDRLLGDDIELHFVPSDNLGNDRVDPGQIEQVIMNLAVNARDAMPDGGKLTIETANVTLDAAYADAHQGVRPGRYIMLAVTDNGTGMDKETLAKVFEPFFTTKQTGKGTGLGLATSYGIAKQHGGNIWVYSEPGQGSTFKVYLPQVADDVPEESKNGAVAVRAVASATILLVEDETSVREVVERMLTHAGHHVLTAGGPGEAREVFAQNADDVSLLFTDVVLPGGNGRKLYEELKQLKPALRVLYMSGYTDNAIVHHGVLDGGTLFIQKPFTQDALVKKVGDALAAE